MAQLNNLRAEYDSRRETIEEQAEAVNEEECMTLIQQMITEYEGDSIYLQDGLNKAVRDYDAKFKNRNTAQQKLIDCNWEIAEFSTLLQQCERYRYTIH